MNLRSIFLVAVILFSVTGVFGQLSEANRQARAFWAAYIPTCNGADYIKEAPDVFVELNGLGVATQIDPLTAADRQNGVEVKGRTSYTASTYRVYSNSIWHKWGNGIPPDLMLSNAARFEKTGGRWIFHGQGYFRNFSNRMVCTDLPWLRPKKLLEIPTNKIKIDDYHIFPVQEFSFWDSGTKLLENQFSATTTTHVNWRILYEEMAFDYRLNGISQDWYGPKGELIYHNDSVNFSNVGRGQLSWTFGYDTPGKWLPGTYTVKVHQNNQLIAEKSFEVKYDDDLPKRLLTHGIYYQSTNEGYWLVKFFDSGKVMDLIIPRPSLDAALNTAFYCFIYNQCDGLGVGTGSYITQGSKVTFTTQPAYGRNKDISISYDGNLEFSSFWFDWRSTNGSKSSASLSFTACPYQGC